jgi:hypothetical protein
MFSTLHSRTIIVLLLLLPLEIPRCTMIMQFHPSPPFYLLSRLILAAYL